MINNLDENTGKQGLPATNILKTAALPTIKNFFEKAPAKNQEEQEYKNRIITHINNDTSEGEISKKNLKLFEEITRCISQKDYAYYNKILNKIFKECDLEKYTFFENFLEKSCEVVKNEILNNTDLISNNLDIDNKINLIRKGYAALLLMQNSEYPTLMQNIDLEKIYNIIIELKEIDQNAFIFFKQIAQYENFSNKIFTNALDLSNLVYKFLTDIKNNYAEVNDQDLILANNDTEKTLLLIECYYKYIKDYDENTENEIVSLRDLLDNNIKKLLIIKHKSNYFFKYPIVIKHENSETFMNQKTWHDYLLKLKYQNIICLIPHDDVGKNIKIDRKYVDNISNQEYKFFITLMSTLEKTKNKELLKIIIHNSKSENIIKQAYQEVCAIIIKKMADYDTKDFKIKYFCQNYVAKENYYIHLIDCAFTDVNDFDKLTESKIDKIHIECLKLLENENITKLTNNYKIILDISEEEKCNQYLNEYFKYPYVIKTNNGLVTINQSKRLTLLNNLLAKLKNRNLIKHLNTHINLNIKISQEISLTQFDYISNAMQDFAKFQEVFTTISKEFKSNDQSVSRLITLLHTKACNIMLDDSTKKSELAEIITKEYDINLIQDNTEKLLFIYNFAFQKKNKPYDENIEKKIQDIKDCYLKNSDKSIIDPREIINIWYTAKNPKFSVKDCSLPGYKYPVLLEIKDNEGKIHTEELSQKEYLHKLNEIKSHLSVAPNKIPEYPAKQDLVINSNDDLESDHHEQPPSKRVANLNEKRLSQQITSWHNLYSKLQSQSSSSNLSVFEKNYLEKTKQKTVTIDLKTLKEIAKISFKQNNIYFRIFADILGLIVFTALLRAIYMLLFKIFLMCPGIQNTASIKKFQCNNLLFSFEPTNENKLFNNELSNLEQETFSCNSWTHRVWTQ